MAESLQPGSASTHPLVKVLGRGGIDLGQVSTQLHCYSPFINRTGELVGQDKNSYHAGQKRLNVGELIYCQ